MLTGYKTYILATLAIVLLLLGDNGIISVSAVNAILPILGFGSVISLRAAIS